MKLEIVREIAEEILLPLFIVVYVIFAIVMFAIGIDKMIFQGSELSDFEMSSNIRRHIDNEAGVVCFTTYRSLSCLPIGDTRLGDDGR